MRGHGRPSAAVRAGVRQQAADPRETPLATLGRPQGVFRGSEAKQNQHHQKTQHKPNQPNTSKTKCLPGSKTITDTQISKAKQPNQNTYTRTLNKPAQHKVSSGVHHYDEPEWAHYLPPIDTDGRLGPSCFAVRPGSAPKWMADLVSSKDATSWFSTTPQGQSIVYADLALMTAAHRDGTWHAIAAGVGFSKLAGGESLLLRAPGQGRWFFSMGDVAGIVTLGWPATVVYKHGRPQYATPDVGSQCQVLVICNDDWQAIHVIAQSARFTCICPLVSLRQPASVVYESHSLAVGTDCPPFGFSPLLVAHTVADAQCCHSVATLLAVGKIWIRPGVLWNAAYKFSKALVLAFLQSCGRFRCQIGGGGMKQGLAR